MQAPVPEVPDMRTPDRTYDMDDGAQWAAYFDPEHPGGFTLLTSAGQELLDNPELRGTLDGLIRQYRAAEVGAIVLRHDPEMRRKLGSGKEATVYSMGDYAVREVTGLTGQYVALRELERMDSITHVIESSLPRWLNLPIHYAAHADPVRMMTYYLMDRVNGGLTVEDVIDYPDIPEPRAGRLSRELGDDIEDAKAQVPLLYERAYDLLATAISETGRNPANYLTDWEPRNVVVEGRLRTPVAGENYRLSVIDQYRN